MASLLAAALLFSCHHELKAEITYLKKKDGGSYQNTIIEKKKK